MKLDNPVARLLVGGLLMIISLVIILWAFRTSNPVLESTDNFLSALGSQNYQAAFNLLSPELQTSWEDSESFGQEIRRADIQPANWRVGQSVRETRRGIVSGSMQLVNGTEQSVYLEFRYINREWRIIYYDFD